MNEFNSHYRFIPWINAKIEINPQFIEINSRLYKNPSPGIVDILLDPANFAKINWRLIAYFCSDPRLINFVVEHIHTRSLENVNDEDRLWQDLCWNDSPAAVAAVLSAGKHVSSDILSVLYRNIYAGEYIEKMSLTDDIKYIMSSSEFSSNSCAEAVSLILNNPECIVWNGMEENTDPRVIEMLISYAPKDFWKNEFVLSKFSTNVCPLAVAFLISNPDKINWRSLSENYSREATIHLSNNIDKIYWPAFCANPLPEALAIMKENLENIEVNGLAANTNPDAFTMLTDGSLPVFAISDEMRGILMSNPLIFERVYNNPRITA